MVTLLNSCSEHTEADGHENAADIVNTDDAHLDGPARYRRLYPNHIPPPAPPIPVIELATPAQTPTVPTSPAAPKIIAAPPQPDISQMTGEEIAKCLQDTKRCTRTISDQLRRLNPTELARALNLARTGSGGRKSLQIDLTHLTDKARFDPKTGSLHNGKATVNIFELGDSMKVIALKDGRIKIKGQLSKAHSPRIRAGQRMRQASSSK